VTQCAPDFCGSPKWSPDGQRLAFERRAAGAAGEGGPSRIWIFGLASDAGAPLFQDDKILGYAPIWSPDGRTIAFVDPQTEAIDVVDLASGKVTYLPSQMGEMGSFSPDGMAMVYSDLRPVGEQVFSELWLGYLGDETKVKLLLDSSEEDQFPAWSPDGKNIAFGRRLLNRSQGLGSQLVLADPVTQAIHKLTNDPTYNNTAFAWSPSGEMLLVQRYNLVAASGRPEIWVYQLSDNHFSKVAENGYGAAWLP
jgi:Tol biopolymer transport system component